MEITLLRHGTRDFVTGDVPLNHLGQIQASELAKTPDLQKVKTILCSPKKRAQMTIQPLAENLGLDIITLPVLDQMMGHESESEFRGRVVGLLETISSGKHQAPVLICSHSDWLSQACRWIPSNDSSLPMHLCATAEYLRFRIENEIWQRLN